MTDEFTGLAPAQPAPTYPVRYMPGVHTTLVQRVLRVNCTKNGCAVPHGDDGMLYELEDADQPTIAGHACDVFDRQVSLQASDWVEVE